MGDVPSPCDNVKVRESPKALCYRSLYERKVRTKRSNLGMVITQRDMQMGDLQPSAKAPLGGPCVQFND